MKFDEVLKELSQEERRKALKLAWMTGAVKPLANLLTRNGHPITEASIRRWRAKREQA